MLPLFCWKLDLCGVAQRALIRDNECFWGPTRMACMSRANLYRGWRWILLKATHAAHVVARAAILG